MEGNICSIYSIGDKESNKKACMMILAKVVDDPQSGSCLNVSYADVVGPVANYNPTGSPYAHSQQVIFINMKSIGSLCKWKLKYQLFAAR